MEDRIKRHNTKRSNATKAGVPWGIVHTEVFKTKSEAYQRELSIKAKKSKAYIEKLIAG